MTIPPTINLHDDRPSLLLVDDDLTFCDVLAKAMTKRGFDVNCAHTVEHALKCTDTCVPEYAIIDLRLPGTSGLVLVEKLRAMDPGTRIVMLTGYASITTAVEAIKLGAIHYLAKPVDADEISRGHTYRGIGLFHQPFSHRAAAVADRQDPVA